MRSREVDSVEFLELDDVRWHDCRIDADGMSGPDDALAAVADRFEGLVRESGRRLAAARVRLVGPSAAHEALWRDPHRFEADVRALALRTGRVWVEKVRIETTRTLDLARAREGDAVGALAERIAELRSAPGSLAAYEPLFEDLRKKLGADVRGDDDIAIEIGRMGTADHLASCLDASLELVVALLAEESG